MSHRAFIIELSLPVFTTKVCRGWDLNTQPFACQANALTDCNTVATADSVVILVTHTIVMYIERTNLQIKQFCGFKLVLS